MFTVNRAVHDLALLWSAALFCLTLTVLSTYTGLAGSPLFIIGAAAQQEDTSEATGGDTGEPAASSDTSPHSSASRGMRFPPQFYVSTGTTIPFPGMDPITQSGNVFYDAINNVARVDGYWLGNTRSLIVDMRRRKGYVLNNDECSVLRLTGDLAPYGVPPGALRHAERVAVRGVPVSQYSVVEKDETLQQVDFFVRQVNQSFGGSSAHDDDDGYDFYHDADYGQHKGAAHEEDAAHGPGSGRDGGAFLMPWRILSRRLRRKEIAPAPFTKVPNWRFFGEPLDELVARDDESAGGPDALALEAVVEDVTVTVDFYNFVPAQPDPSLFVPPLRCREVEAEQQQQQQSNADGTAGGGTDVLPSQTSLLAQQLEFSHDVHLHHAQRLLVDLSFNSDAGRRLLRRRLRHLRRRRDRNARAAKIKQDAKQAHEEALVQSRASTAGGTGRCSLHPPADSAGRQHGTCGMASSPSGGDHAQTKQEREQPASTPVDVDDL